VIISRRIDLISSAWRVDPRRPSFFPEQAAEDPLEVTDYYEAMRKGWLDRGMDQEGDQA